MLTCFFGQAKEKGGADLLGRPWNAAFGENAAMAEGLRSSESSDPCKCYGLDEHQAGQMKGILDASIRIHKAPGATASEGTVALYGLCQRVIMLVLSGIKGRKELPRNIAWVITKLRVGMEEVAAFMESVSAERSTFVQHVVNIVGGVAENPPRAQLARFEVTLRGILSVIKSKDALPQLPEGTSSIGIPQSTPEEPEDPRLPLPWDAYDMAQSLHDFAKQLGHRQVRA